VKLFFAIFFVFSIYSCQVDCNDLTYKEGLTYLKDKLYSGDCSSYFPSSGQIRSYQSYVDGKDDGEWKFYHPGKIPQTIGVFDEGKRIGTWKYFYPDGKVWKTNNYNSLGEKTGKWTTYSKDGSIDTLVTFNSSN
tara:strand:- start:3360 stop:3764 length:405 start_codon:yes stop_codon:yes gene_type:complete